MPDADAETVAEVLVEADLRGVESHGTTRVAGYVSMIKGGLLNPKPTVEVFRDTPSTAMLEGDRAFGIVVATRAMRLAIGKAARAGVACVTARNVTHTGMVGFYPMLAARAGMIGVAVNNGPAILPPFVPLSMPRKGYTSQGSSSGPKTGRAGGSLLRLELP